MQTTQGIAYRPVLKEINQAMKASKSMEYRRILSNP